MPRGLDQRIFEVHDWTPDGESFAGALHGVHFDRDQTDGSIFKTIGEFIEMIEREKRGQERRAVRGQHSKSSPRLRKSWADIGVPPYFDPSLGVPPNLWIGPGR